MQKEAATLHAKLEDGVRVSNTMQVDAKLWYRIFNLHCVNASFSLFISRLTSLSLLMNFLVMNLTKNILVGTSYLLCRSGRHAAREGAHDLPTQGSAARGEC